MTKQEFLNQHSVMVASYENDVVVKLEDLDERELQSEFDFLGSLIASLTYLMETRRPEDSIYIEAAKLLYEIYRDCED